MLPRPAYLDASFIGRPLPWSLYTANGVLAAAAGSIVQDAEQLRRLATRALYRQAAPVEDGIDPAHRLATLADQLAELLLAPGPGLPERLDNLAEELRCLWAFDADASLGLARVLPGIRPAIRHCLLVALVCLELAAEMGQEEEEVRTLVRAALTMNIAELALHDALALGLTAFTETERRAIQGHPERGAECLAAAGVEDAIWLTAVRQHHAHLDGSGYPAGLAGAAIGRPARILRVADYYCAKISGRYYRPPKDAQFALKQMFGPEKGRLDTQITVLLPRLLGLYPPGTLIRLENRETAVATRRAEHPCHLRQVVSFLDYRGQLMERPAPRDIAQPAYLIHAVTEAAADWPGVSWCRLWGY